jgi:hypothetical protein
MGPQLGMRKLDKDVRVHERKKTGLEYLQWLSSERDTNKFYIINRQEDVIQEDQEEYGLILEDGQHLQMEMSFTPQSFAGREVC